MTERPFRFAVALAAQTSPQELRMTARDAEDLGYSLIMCSDHLHQRLSPLAAAQAAASCTSTIGISTYVLNCDFRNPRVAARELQSVHDLSGGRLTVGLGAGWLRSDYTTGDIAFGDGGTRAGHFESAFQIIKDHLAACAHAPDGQPAERTGPPPMLVGAGQRRMLSFAARNADIVSFTPASTPDGALDELDATAQSYDRKVEWVKAAAGPRWHQLEINYVTWECFVTPRPGRVLAALSAAMRMPEAAVREIPSMLIGSADEIAETLMRRRERWAGSLVSVPMAAMRAFAPIVSRLSGR